MILENERRSEARTLNLDSLLNCKTRSCERYDIKGSCWFQNKMCPSFCWLELKQHSFIKHSRINVAILVV